MDNYISKKMFVEEYDEDIEYDPEWIFPGWIGFKCFGIKVPKEYADEINDSEGHPSG